MLQIVKTLWNKYKALAWWKQVLFALPFLAAIILICLFLFWKPSNDSKKFENAVEYAKNQVDIRIADKLEQDKVLAKKDKELAQTEEALKKEIQDHEKDAANIVNAINNATDTLDIEKLKRIHQRLNDARNK